MVGLDALGVPLDEDHVCRAEIVIKVAQTTDKVTHVTPCIVGKVMGNRDLWCHQLSNPVPYHIVVNKVDCTSQIGLGREILVAIQQSGRGFASISLTGQTSAGRKLWEHVKT